MSYKFINTKFVEEIFETIDYDYSIWFGYYNYDVLSSDGKKMLCNRAKFDSRHINSNDSIEVGYYDISNNKWNKIGTSSSFNWEQGALLQWVPNKINKVIYNDFDGEKFCSYICDILTGEKKKVDYPIYCVNFDGNSAITLNFERSYWCRAYHYQNVKNNKYNVNIASDDGVFNIDFNKNKIKRIISIQDIIHCDYDNDFYKAKHWVEHIMLSKDGSQLAFLHRLSFGGDYITRILVSNINGENLQIVPGWREYKYTHLGWDKKNRFIVYGNKMNRIESTYTQEISRNNINNSLKKQLLNIIKHYVPKKIKNVLKSYDNGYRIFEYNGNQFFIKNNLHSKYFNIDGHPSFTDDGKYIVTDTYPDDEGNQNLIVFNIETNKTILLAKLEATLRGNPASCDLHPKLCFKNTIIIVDTAYTGKHRMIALKPDWQKIKKYLE